jgi:hypothetical protein
LVCLDIQEAGVYGHVRDKKKLSVSLCCGPSHSIKDIIVLMPPGCYLP